MFGASQTRLRYLPIDDCNVANVEHQISKQQQSLDPPRTKQADAKEEQLGCVQQPIDYLQV